MNCQECEELSGAYALGALSAAEQEEVATHLAECADCSHMIEDLQRTMNLLPMTVPQIEPSPKLKGMVMEQIRNAARPAGIQQLRPQALRRRSTWTRLQMSLVAAAAVLLLAFTSTMIAWNISLQHQLALLTPVHTGIQGTDQGAAAHGQITYLPQQDLSIISVQNLPALKDTQVYQGWVLQGKQPTSVGVFTVQNGTATLNVQGNLHTYTAVAISLEPGPQPSIGAPKGPIIALSH